MSSGKDKGEWSDHPPCVRKNRPIAKKVEVGTGALRVGCVLSTVRPHIRPDSGVLKHEGRISNRTEFRDEYEEPQFQTRHKSLERQRPVSRNSEDHESKDARFADGTTTKSHFKSYNGLSNRYTIDFQWIPVI